MRRIIAAIILTFMIVAVGLTGRYLTNQSIYYIQMSMKKIDTALSDGNEKEALQVCNNFLQQWEKHHGRLCMFLQHEHLDPIENIISVLPFYIEKGDSIPAQAECRTVISITEHILKTERVSLENIL